MSSHLNKLMQMVLLRSWWFCFGARPKPLFVCMKNPASSNQNTEYIHRNTDEDGIANCFTNGDQKTSKRINISFTVFKWLEATVTGKQLRWSFGIWSLWRSFSHVQLRGDSRVDLKPTEEVYIYLILVCHPQEELESLAREMDSCLAFTSAFTAFFFFMWCKKVDFEININGPTSHFLFCFLVFFIFQSFETKLFNCIWYLCVEVYMCDLLRYCLCLSSDWMKLASS